MLAKYVVSPFLRILGWLEKSLLSRCEDKSLQSLLCEDPRSFPKMWSQDTLSLL